MRSDFFRVNAQVSNTAKMNEFVNALMKKMTLDEKIGQLNLVTPGGAVTGAVVSKDVDTKIRKGRLADCLVLRGRIKSEGRRKLL